ncbi:MAG: C25 family cysteine peptidase [Bacteroidota bacterium]
MKKITTLFLSAIILPASLHAGQWIGINSNNAAPVKVNLVSTNQDETILNMEVKGYYQSTVTTPRGNAVTINALRTTPLLQTGAPDVSKVSASIIIPDYAKMKVDILSSAYTDYANIELAPSKGHLLRTVDRSDVPYTYGDVYKQNNFFPGALTELQKPFIVRDFRGQTVWFYPFQYNPSTKVLRVYSNITVKISVENQNGENVFNRTHPLVSIDKEYAQIYTSLFRNGNNAVSYIPMTEDGSMLIISETNYMNAMNSFIEWKAKRGLGCEMVDLATIGNTSAAIQNYISGYYGTHNLKYVLLVGDMPNMPTPYLSGGASDPSYGYLTGSDSYAEVIVGRISAQSLADVETQVQRSIDYEANPTVGGTWYAKATGIASNQGPGDDNEMDWEHERNIRADLMNYGYTEVDELYDGSQGGGDANGDPLPIDLINSINAGRSVINYTGHGSQSCCAQTGFCSSDVTSLTNYGMLPYWWSVGCVHGEFDNGTCIAEVLLRAQDAGQPKGMVATLMSSVNQYWNEPMDAQDEFDSILTESYVNNIKRTYGGISVNGCMHMNDDYGTTGDDMTNTWHCFGDPSFVIRTTVPVSLTASHVTVDPIGTSQLLVNCNINDAVVTITKGANILGMGIVQGNVVTLTFAAVMQVDTFDITATAFNCIPYQGKLYIVDNTGINENTTGSAEFTVSPNPVNNNATLAFDLPSFSHVSIFVNDADGKRVKAIADNSLLKKGKQQITFSTQSYAKGIYLVHLITDGKESIVKMVK